MRIRDAFLVLCATWVSTSAAAAQDVGQVGVTIAYPAAIGAIWHVTDHVAIRPDFSFTHTNSDSLATSTTLASVGVSGLLYVGKWDGVRAYVSPRFGYQRVSNTSSTAVIGTVMTSSVTTGTYTGGGAFGAQYLLHRRFALFGETGVTYSHLSTTGSAGVIALIDDMSHSWGTRAGVGIIFYL